MMRDITMLMADDKTRPQLRRFVAILKRIKKLNDEAARLKFKAELKADPKEALKEVKEAKEGKCELRDARELIYEL